MVERLVLKDYSEYIKLVSTAYHEAPDYDAKVVHHWNALNASNHTLFKRLLSKVNVIFVTNDKNKIGSIDIDGRSFKIEFIDPKDEYKTQSEMKASFQKTGVLKISIDYTEHPVFSVADNIVFRTVHDYIAHILGNHNFGEKGEIACYNQHVKMAPNDAKPALFTEIVGQVSYTIVNGSFPKQKIVVLSGFDFDNIGYVDDADYVVKDKLLMNKNKQSSVPTQKKNDEPLAIRND